MRHPRTRQCCIKIVILFFFWVQVRLGWHDSGTYDKNVEEWPQCGGADGSLRFDAELKHGANAGNFCYLYSTRNILSRFDLIFFAGLINALKLIQPIKDKYPGITYADLFQLASATAIEVIVLSLLCSSISLG